MVGVCLRQAFRGDFGPAEWLEKRGRTFHGQFMAKSAREDELSNPPSLNLNTKIEKQAYQLAAKG
jgi:hypothetical protein